MNVSASLTLKLNGASRRIDVIELSSPDPFLDKLCSYEWPEPLTTMKWVQSARLSITKTKLKKVQTLDHRFSNLILKRTLVARAEDIQAVVAALFDQ